MELDYTEIGRRIALQRKKLHLTQSAVAERAEIDPKYLSRIEHARSIPSTEVVMRLALALETTPDAFLVGTARHKDERWKNVAERLRSMDDKQLDMADSFLAWLSERA